jgi:hypothetical protein
MNRMKKFMVLMASGSAAPVTYTISGTVYDADGTTPVEGATVALGLLTATSAANGTYTISDVPAGASGSMTCTLAGYLWAAITVAEMSGSLTSQNYTNVWYAAGGSLASCVIAYKPIGAANLAASYVNLANPGTYNASVFPTKSAPTFSAVTGWAFDSGSSNVLTTSYTPPDQVARTMAIRISDGSAGYACGTRSTSGTNWLALQTTNGTAGIFRIGSNNYTHSTTIFSGVVIAAGLDPYINGSDVGNIAAGTYALTHEFLIGGYNNAGTAATLYTGKVQAFALYTSTLNATQVGILSTAMANFT